MNQKIIEFAVKAGLAYKTGSRWWIDAGEVDIHLERFAELVRQDEREECATLCKVMLWRTPYEVVVEARIRGRGNT